jgi:ribosomal protein L7Ae-like RNA K-turn-binding protein
MRPKPPRGTETRPPRGKGTSSPASPAGGAEAVRRRAQSLLGFAVKAGRVTPGFALTRQGLAHGDVRFVLAARDLAARRLEALLSAAGERGVGCFVGWTQAELGDLLGRGPTGAVGVTDASLARGLGACTGAGAARVRRAIPGRRRGAGAARPA